MLLGYLIIALSPKKKESKKKNDFAKNMWKNQMEILMENVVRIL